MAPIDTFSRDPKVLNQEYPDDSMPKRAMSH